MDGFMEYSVCSEEVREGVGMNLKQLHDVEVSEQNAMIRNLKHKY